LSQSANSVFSVHVSGILEMGSPEQFSWLASNLEDLMSASQVPRTIGVSHQHPAYASNFFYIHTFLSKK
jgi:hypothetical protein